MAEEKWKPQKRVCAYLDSETWEALRDRAEKDERDIRREAAYLIRKALEGAK